MAQKTGIQSEGSPQLFDKEILRVDSVAALLEYSTDHVYRLVSQKKIPFRKKGKTLFFLRQEILDWVYQGDQ